MKPPPRTRTKPERHLRSEERSGEGLRGWTPAELRKLLKALKTLGTTGAHQDLDYAVLKKHVPTRSNSEIQSVVDSLKDKVICSASAELTKKKQENEKARKPIEMWTHMAYTVTGNLEECISSAFSQMLAVSSTEPCTLRNSDPPQVLRPPTGQIVPSGGTIPFGPRPHLPVQARCEQIPHQDIALPQLQEAAATTTPPSGEGPATNTARPLPVLRTPAPTMGPAKRLPALSKVVRVSNSNTPLPQQQSSATPRTLPAATTYHPGTAGTTPQSVILVRTQATPISSSVVQTTQQPSGQHVTSTSSIMSTSSSPHTPSAILTLSPRTAPSSVISSSSATSSYSPALSVLPFPSGGDMAVHSNIGHTTKHDTKHSSSTAVDFERIYHYLSVIHKPNEDCCLTSMESAVVLSLLMSLPEELSLLDCNKLRKHLIQVYCCLSSPVNSKKAREMFKDLKDGVSSSMEAVSDGDSNDAMNTGNIQLQQDNAESQSSVNDNKSSKSGRTVGLCPLLNPFMVPLKMLVRK